MSEYDQATAELAYSRVAELEAALDKFMEWKAPERSLAPVKGIDWTEPDHCPCCGGEHHQKYHRDDCPFVSARAALRGKEGE